MNESVDISSFPKLTVRQLLLLTRRLTIGSILTAIALLTGLVVGSFSIGVAFSEGLLPSAVYDLLDTKPNPREFRKALASRKRFIDEYGTRLVDHQILVPIGRNIERLEPDGLDGPYEILASFLAQVRATGGSASFLSGKTEHTVTLTFLDGEIALEWEENGSLVPEMAANAGFALSPEELKLVNQNINWAHYSYLDDEQSYAVILREPDGGLSLTLKE